MSHTALRSLEEVADFVEQLTLIDGAFTSPRGSQQVR